ncbi:hypothetical protein [Aneurinibacillus tyrosinisolvens]|uniref:hypothetical protein n=1 Tax=Aneurinibacillus tyrosinisolvens TaxID=1443435 RepID=UPI00063F5536|nr:hypothetical protein [Aneurinibacillus tyrosinisolvens]
MTNKQAVSYTILALNKLGYDLGDIRKIRREMENQIDLYSENEAEWKAVHLISELIENHLKDIKLEPRNWKEFIERDTVI